MQDLSWCDDLKWPDFSGSKEHFSNIYTISREHQHHISINLKVVLPSVFSFWDSKEDSITCHSWALVYPTINQACWHLATAFLRCEEFLYERINLVQSDWKYIVPIRAVLSRGRWQHWFNTWQTRRKGGGSFHLECQCSFDARFFFVFF